MTCKPTPPFILSLSTPFYSPHTPLTLPLVIKLHTNTKTEHTRKQRKNRASKAEKGKDPALSMGSIQNQEQTQNTNQLKSVIEAQIERENQQNHQIQSSNEGNAEKQSMSLSIFLSSHQCEIGDEDGKLEDSHEGTAQEDPMTSNERVEERESKEKNSNSGTGSGGAAGPRERLKRHRTEVAGHVWIPDMWGQEELLKDWIDCNAFDACLVPKGLMSARASLIQEGRRANSASITVENSC